MTRTLITTRVLIQIQLVISLSIPPLACGQNLGDDLAILPPLLLDLLCDLAGLLFLLGGVGEDTAAVLGAGIGSLAVVCRWVVHAVEEFEEGAVRDLFGVVNHLKGFGVWRIVFSLALFLLASLVVLREGVGEEKKDSEKKARLTSGATRADSSVRRVGGVATNVSNARIKHGVLGEMVAVHVLDTPEAPGSNCSLLHALRDSSGVLLACCAFWSEAHGG